MTDGGDRASDETRVNVSKASEQTRVVPLHEPRGAAGRAGSLAPTSEFVAGDRFGGFVIERELGRGRMGVVYRAKRLSLDRVEAVKIMAPAFSRDPEVRTRLKLEAMHVAIANHRHVVAVYDAEERDGLLYMAMEYVGGTDLKTRIASDGAVPPGTAAQITRQVASALDAAHSVGVIHRDVKPANILLAGERGREHACLTDFGVSRRLDDPIDLTTAHGSTVGTPHYTAPEAYQNRPVDNRADVYSLGCVLFEMLTGRKPFPGKSSAQVAIAHVNQPPPEVHHVGGPTLHPFDEVIRKSMAKDPAQRYQSAGELGIAAVAAAERSAGSEAAPTDLPSPTERVSVPPPPLLEGRSKRGRRPALLIGAMVTLALAGGGVAADIAASSGHSVTGQTTHPATISPSQAAMIHTTTATRNPILKAVEGVNVSVTAKGMLPLSSCKVMDASMVTCTNPIPAVDAVTFQTFPSMKALYAAYAKRVSELAQGPFRANFANCTEVHTNGEVSWNHNYKHPSIYPLTDFTSGRITDDQAAGRVYCTFDQDMLHLVWTQDDGYLMGEIAGAPHTDAYVWWRQVHHSIVLPGVVGMQNMKGIQSTMGTHRMKGMQSTMGTHRMNVTQSGNRMQSTNGMSGTTK